MAKISDSPTDRAPITICASQKSSLGFLIKCINALKVGGKYNINTTKADVTTIAQNKPLTHAANSKPNNAIGTRLRRRLSAIFKIDKALNGLRTFLFD